MLRGKMADARSYSQLDECVEEDGCAPDIIQPVFSDPRTCYNFKQTDSNYGRTSSGRVVSICDSGFHSANVDSVDCDINFTVAGLQRLSVDDGQKKFASVEHFDSGFRSGDALLDSGNLPYGTQETLQCENDESANYEDGVFVSEEQRMIFEQDEDGDTQLHMAIIQLVPMLTECVIQRAWKSDCVNLMNKLRQSPLHLSVIINQPETTYTLMCAGALLDQQDNKGNTPLHIACKEGFPLCAEVLTRPVRPSDAYQHYALPQQCIPQKLEEVNYEGKTCLHLAAENYLRPCPDDAYMKIVKLLLSKGANVNAPDGKSGRTILHYCAEYGNMELLHVILQQPQVNLNAKTYGAKTAVMLAQGRGFFAMVDRLVECGANPPPNGMDFRDSDSSEEMSDDESAEYPDFHINGTPLPV